jgi:DNA-binding CsgD family transcriptional regulator
MARVKTINFIGYNFCCFPMAFSLTPVSGPALVDREEIIEEMCSELGRPGSKIGYALTGIRRVGKSSILREVRRRLVGEGVPTIYLSLWEVTPFTLDQFIQMLVDKVAAEFEPYLPWRLRVRQYLAVTRKAFSDLISSLRISAEVGEHLEVTFSFLKGDREDPGTAIHHAFALPESLAGETDKKCVLMLDEFPSIMDLTYGKRNRRIGDSIVKALRSDYENFQRTAIVISGSIRRTVRAVLGPAGALWKQLLLREVEPFDLDATMEFLNKYARHRKDIIEQGSTIFEVTGGIPYNLQLVCRKLVLETERIGGPEGVVNGVRELLKQEGRLHFQEYLQDLIPSEAKVLIQLASGSHSPSQIAEAALMELSSVTGLLNNLRDKGYVRRMERGLYSIIDPLFESWLKTEFVED